MSLLKPPPLDVPLVRQCADDGSVSLLRGDDVIATAVPGAVEAQAPPAPTVEQAEIATLRYVGFAHHRFPTCFVCGTARDDGLRIYAGQVGDSPLIASPWTPESDDPLFVWAVLDCPSAYAIESVDHRAQIVVLASLTVELRERPRAGERHVVAAWPVSSDGRKHHSASALYDASGASSRSPTHSGSSYETPPRSAAEPLDSDTDCALADVKAVFTRSWSSIGRSARRRGDMSARPARRARAWASSAASVASGSRRASLVRISTARS